MANTTFSGPIRSETTVKTISKNSSTGAITEIITMGDAPVALGDENKTLDAATHSGRTLVVPAIDVTIDFSSFKSAFIKELLPTFGIPTIARLI